MTAPQAEQYQFTADQRWVPHLQQCKQKGKDMTESKTSVGGSERQQGGARHSSFLTQALCVLVPSTLVLLAFYSSLTHQVQRVWGASGTFWQHQYDKVAHTCHHDSFTLFVHGTGVVGYMVYMVVGGLYTLMDVTNRPAVLRRYKVQPGTNEPVQGWHLTKCLLVVHFNLLVTGVPFVIGCYHMMHVRGGDMSPTLPALHTVILHLAGCLLMEEIGFYYGHRLFHQPLLYKRFHKLHHEWQSPIAVTAAYAHPVEHVVSNLVPIMAGPLVLGSHIAVVWLWVALATVFTLVHHSGYHFPFFPTNEFHDFHHLKFTECYGVLGILDRFHGTDAKFRKTKYCLRNRTLLSLSPAREVYPDDDNENIKAQKKH